MKTLLLENATYIHVDDRDMANELARVRRWRHKPIKAVPDIPTLAERAATHYARLKQTSQRIQIKVHVFPVLPSGRGQSAEFRAELACELAGISYYAGRGSQWRRSAEKEARAKGFNFVEVYTKDFL